MEHALVLKGNCVRANMWWNLGQTVPARAGDPTADKILENLILALKEGSRIVINDHVVPKPGELSP
jgi:hypothetical protein